MNVTETTTKYSKNNSRISEKALFRCQIINTTKLNKKKILYLRSTSITIIAFIQKIYRNNTVYLFQNLRP